MHGWCAYCQFLGRILYFLFGLSSYLHHDSKLILERNNYKMQNGNNIKDGFEPRLEISLTIDRSKLLMAQDFSLECLRNGESLPSEAPPPWPNGSWTDSVKGLPNRQTLHLLLPGEMAWCRLGEVRHHEVVSEHQRLLNPPPALVNVTVPFCLDSGQQNAS